MSLSRKLDDLAVQSVEWTVRQFQKRVPYSSSNFYLEGPYAPVTEERTETELHVTGSIPPELNGLYARIGPNPLHVDNPAAYHLFLGDGMVHGVRLRDGKALSYRNRWVGARSVNRKLGRPFLEGTGPFDVVNTNIIGHGGRIWALVEGGVTPAEMDGDLNTLKRGLFDSGAHKGYTAHPKLDPLTGDLHAICYSVTAPNKIFHVVVNAQCQVTQTTAIPVTHGPMVHDCAVTASNVVVLDLPVTLTPMDLLRGSQYPFRWNEKHRARVGLLPKQGNADQIRWFDVEPCYVFHTGNAVDLPDGGAMIDVVVHDRIFDRSTQDLARSPVTLERWTLNPQRRDVKREVLCDRRQEFPRFDERLSGQDYRYLYSVGIDTTQHIPQPLYRYDLKTGQRQEHHYGPNGLTGEVVFVPRSNDSAEDDGWLLSYVYDLEQERSDLVILNAQDIEGEPQAIVHLPVRVPLGFHGNWIADPVSR
ncbi:MAG TPA: carotenoid oxygenase family protein [Dongiaceae bacterium]|nr:carotenoid oxygenase family protein [Dongiaceae bacterium]